MEFKEKRMFIEIQFIPGLMFGVEYIYQDGFLVFDLGIVRVFIGKVPKGEVYE